MLTDIASPVVKRDDAPLGSEAIEERSERVMERVIAEIAADAREDAKRYLDEVVTPHGGE
jgi:hypothetical protein